MALRNPLNMPRPYRVYGHTLSYFTRKLTGYMADKGRPWQLRLQTYPDHVLATKWPVGMPVVETPEGEIIWDTASVIRHQISPRNTQPRPRSTAMNTTNGDSQNR